jgi:hypothetical protein
MSRDENGQMRFSIHDVGVILGIILSLGAIAGGVGAYYVNAYRLNQVETSSADLRHQFVTHETRDTAQDLAIASLGPKIDYLIKGLDELKQDQRSGGKR